MMVEAFLRRGVYCVRGCPSLSTPTWMRAMSSVSAPTAAARSPGEYEESSTTATDASNAVQRVLVFGGSGYVGRRVCRSLLDVARSCGRGVSVASVSRGGRFTQSEPWANDIDWLRADATSLIDGDGGADAATITAALRDADAVVSCIGAFGSDSFMERVNGDVNVSLARAFASTATAHTSARFVFVSSAEFPLLPSFVLGGYFRGKRNAEAEAAAVFGGRATILRPSFVHGSRDVPGGLRIPLHLVGVPLERACSAILPSVSPVSVDVVGRAAAAAALNGNGNAGADGDAAAFWDYATMLERSNRGA